MTHTHRFESAAAAVEFALSGKARLTLVSLKTHQRFTYRVTISKDSRRFYVGVLAGPDNTQAYTFLGTIFPGIEGTGEPHRFALARGGKVSPEAPSALAFTWAWRNLAGERKLPASLEVWHEGYCGRCGRLLTTPESIERGLGPECAKRYGAASSLAIEEYSDALKGDLRK